MTKLTYLLINLATVFFPLVLSFDKRVGYYKSWRFLWPGLVLSGVLFLIWDVLFTVKNVWSFNSNYIMGITILNLPVEEALFFLTIPFACVFIYVCIEHYFKYDLNEFVSEIISASLIVFSALSVFFNMHRTYTLVTFALLAVLLILFQYVWRFTWLKRFYLVYIVTMIPFYIVNGILTSLPVVIYNNHQNLGIRVWSIPLEDHFYLMALLLMNVGFFEYFRAKGGRLSGD